MKWFRTLGMVMMGLALLAACEQGGAPLSPPEQPKTDFGFTKPGPETPGQSGLSGTVGEKPGTPVNEAQKDTCVQALNSGKKYEELSAECKKVIDAAAANVGSAISGAAAAMQSLISGASSAVSSATSGFKMPSFSFGSFNSGIPAATALPEGCHQDGDVGLAITDPNLRAAISKVISKGTASIQITAYDAIKLTWLEIPNKDGKDIKSLDGIQCFINLGLLDVSGHPVASLHPITGLSKLSVLKISKTQISDLVPISKLPIVYLYINEDAGIKDLTPLLSLETLKGGLISALGNPQLKQCQLEQLSKLYKVETYDVYCPDADPNASGCGPCGDNGYECNTKMESKNYTAVIFNQSTSCEPQQLASTDLKFNETCKFDNLNMSIYLTYAGSGSSVRVELQDKDGKALSKSAAYNLNGKDGNRTFDLALSNTVPCEKVNSDLAKVVFYFTDSGWVDMSYYVDYFYLNAQSQIQAYLIDDFKGGVDGDSATVVRAYPSAFSGPATLTTPAVFDK